jgi:beta-glucosidase/6-phospho-beta-glucosidase/beta-galactosidase
VGVRLPAASEVSELLNGFPWPEHLLIGAATAGYQCEGGYNVGEGPRNNWAEWESRPGNERTGTGARFWDFPERDFALARDLGLNVHRMSIEWARVQPIRARRLSAEPPPWDYAALDRYVDIIGLCREYGLEPMITLHHFTHPYWLGHDMWLEDKSVDLFIRWVKELMPALTERLVAKGHAPIRYWITINEPNVMAPGTFMARWMPSDAPLDLGSPGRTVRALDNMYAAHVRAYNVIHRYYEETRLPKPMVSLNNFALDFYEGDRIFIDLLLARSRKVAFGVPLRKDIEQRAAAHAESLANLIGRAWTTAPSRWFAARGFRAAGPQLFAERRLTRTKAAIEASDYDRPLDYFAIDYYDPTLANQIQLASGGYEPWQWEIIPEGLHDILKAYATDGLPILIAENGMAVRRPLGAKADTRQDGATRDEFIRAHLYHALRALKGGVPLLGYLHWSLTDNYEWGRFSPRFGIHAVDFSHEEKTRLPVDAAGVDAAKTLRSITQALKNKDAVSLALALAG